MSIIYKFYNISSILQKANLNIIILNIKVYMFIKLTKNLTLLNLKFLGQIALYIAFV